ncbi:MAG: MFS transporter [Pseudoclavibacter sp.]
MTTQAAPATTLTGVRLNRSHLKVVVISALLMTIDGYDLVSFGSALPLLIADWGVDSVLMGYVASAALLGVFVGGLLVSPLADRVGRRPVIAGTILVAGLAAFACGFTSDPFTLAALRFVVGLAIGGLMPNFISLTAEVAPPRYRAGFVATVSAFYAIGGLIAAWVGMTLAPAFGWQIVFILAGVAVLFAPISLWLLPESPEFLAVRGERARLARTLAEYAPGVDPDTFGAAIGDRESARSPVTRILSRSNALATVFIWVFFTMTMILSYALLTWLPVLMQQSGYALASSVLTLVSLNIGGFIGSVAGGWIAARFTFRRTLTVYFCLAVLALVGLAFNPPAVVLYLILAIAGFAVIGILAIIHAFAVEFYPAAVRSTGVGWATGVGRIGAILGPIIGGMLVAAALPLPVNFLVFVAPAAIGLIAVLVVAARRYRDA